MAPERDLPVHLYGVKESATITGADFATGEAGAVAPTVTMGDTAR